MSMTILPVGKPLGACFAASEPPSEEPEFYEVHVGNEVEQLTPLEWFVYCGAYGDADQHADHLVDRDWLIKQLASEVSASKISAEIDGLLGRGLLLEANLRGNSAVDVLTGYRIVPTGVGISNSPQDPGLRWIGQHGEGMLGIPQLSFLVWAFSYRTNSMWDCCTMFAQNPDGVDGATAEDIAAQIADSLPSIVSMELGYLEPADR
ncbi:hypothetical protein LX16_0300 [Stackebrandtia albiflava]|uniref:Uncharacterized protein n=1 Tax=Stackebrandtia albiflava TaxID=406432 RepID=A0A562V9S9_9ACTN|nr:hypothetical protein [Stackebrandtia albiflava]TWJ14615.1 hypothetical protein LX16_0300 [Stackebrandtia albiflava]